jgi:hypothetical protein
MADIVARPPGQPPAWDAAEEGIVETILRRTDRNDLETRALSPAEQELESRMTALVNGVEARQADMPALAAQEAESSELELRWLAGKLQARRNKERTLDEIADAAPSTQYRQDTFRRQAAQRAEIQSKKMKVKRLAKIRHATELTKFLQQSTMHVADELTQLRLKQYGLGRELGAGLLHRSGAADVRAAIKAIDEEKKKLKHEARRFYGLGLGRMTQPVKTRKQAKMDASVGEKLAKA